MRRFLLAGMWSGVPQRDPGGVALRCLIVDDNSRFLSAATDLLEREGIAVVGVAATSAEALARSQELQPDVVLVDIDLGEENGFDLAVRLANGGGSGSPPVILISTYTEGDVDELVAASPAIGFLSKSKISRQAIADLLERSAS
jgi:CheY-like chemotaxis protein